MISDSLETFQHQPSLREEIIPKKANIPISDSFQGGKKLGRMLSEKSCTQTKIQHNQVQNLTKNNQNPFRKQQSQYYMRGSQGTNPSKDSSLESFQNNQTPSQRYSERNLQHQAQKIKNLRSSKDDNNSTNTYLSNSTTSAFWRQSPCKTLESNTLMTSMNFQSQNNLHQSIIAQQTPKRTPMSQDKNLPAFIVAKSTDTMNQTNNSLRKTIILPENDTNHLMHGSQQQHNQPITKKLLKASSFQAQLQQQQQQQQQFKSYPSKSNPFLHASPAKTTYSRDKWVSLNSNDFSTFHPLNPSQYSINAPFPQSFPLNSTQELPSIQFLPNNNDKLNHTTPYFRQLHNSSEILHRITLSESEMKLGMDKIEQSRYPKHRQPSIQYSTATRQHNNEGRKNNFNSTSVTDMNIHHKTEEQQLYPISSATDMNFTHKISKNNGTLYQRFLANLPGIEVRSWQTRLEEQLKQQKTPKHCILTQVFDKEFVNLQDLNATSQGLQQNLSKYTNDIPGSDGSQQLRFPASQKELQQFSAALDENELRFSRKKDPQGFQEDIMNRKSGSRLRGQDHKIHQSLSMKIEEKLRERNSIIEQQKVLQRKLTLETEMRQTVQIDTLIKEQQQLNQGKQYNQQLYEHGRQYEQKVILGQQRMIEKNDMNEREQFYKNNNNNNNEPRMDVENDLAKETHLVDFLQQKKRKVREVLERFLLSRPHFIKQIGRSCLMDADEFVFFTMSFYQYCVEDMFARFKENNTQRLAAIASKKQTSFITNIMITGNNNCNNQSKQKITDIISVTHENTSNEVGVTAREFNFGQKIPQEIMKIVVDVIKHALQGTEKELRIEEHMQRSSLTGAQNQKISGNKNNINIRRTFKKGKQSPQDKIELGNNLGGIAQQLNNQSDNLDGITTNREDKQILNEIDGNNQQAPDKINNNNDILNQNLSLFTSEDCFTSLDDKLSWLNANVQSQFLTVMQWNIRKQILPATIIEQIGGFVRVRQLIVTGVKSINNYINTSSKMNLLEEDDQELLDKHLMACICGLLSNDKETVNKEISIWKERGNQMSFYDFYTVKKLAWEITGGINLDPKLRFYIIMQIENLRYQIFNHPFSQSMGNLAQSLMNSYQLANYFRNPKNITETGIFFDMLFPVIYNNQPYEQFFNVISPKLKFQFNDRFFDHLLQFLVEQLKETDSKSVLDLELRIMKLRIKAGVRQNLFNVINQNAEKFFEDLLPFLQGWVQKYTLSNTLMEAKAMDFTFLEVFIKQALNIQDLYGVLDTEPALLHFVINQSMLVFWIKGIVAYFEEKGIVKGAYKQLIVFITQCLLFRKEIEEQSELQQQSQKNLEDGTAKGQKQQKNE